jgi:hypothetical protein
VLHARRHGDAVHLLQVRALGTATETCLPFEDDVDLVGAAVLTPGLLLVWLQANELADQPRAVEDGYADRLLAQEVTQAVKVGYVHRRALG